MFTSISSAYCPVKGMSFFLAMPSRAEKPPRTDSENKEMFGQCT